jgi:C-terminal processing protease CtpA/Prc
VHPGLAFGARKKGGFFISSIASNGAAERSGRLRIGDILVAMDGKLLDRIKRPNLPRMLLGRQGTSLTLTLCRVPSTDTFQVTLVRSVNVAPVPGPDVCLGVGEATTSTFLAESIKSLNAAPAPLASSGPQSLTSSCCSMASFAVTDVT